MKKNKMKIIALTLFFNFVSLQSATPVTPVDAHSSFDTQLIIMSKTKTNSDKGFSLLKSLISDLPKHENHPNFGEIIRKLNDRLKCHRTKSEYNVLFKILNTLRTERRQKQWRTSTNTYRRNLLNPHTALEEAQSRSTPVATTIATDPITQEAPTDLDRAIDSEEIYALEKFLFLGSASTTYPEANVLLPPPLDTPLPTTTLTFQETEEEEEEEESTIVIPSALQEEDTTLAERAKSARRSIEYQQLIETLEIDKIKSAQDIADKVVLIEEHYIDDENIRFLINKLINHMNKFFKEDPQYPEIFETLDTLSYEIRRKKGRIHSVTYRRKKK